MQKKILSSLSVLIGLALLAVSVIYFKTPAGSLPSYMPGFESGSDHIHVKHGIASALLALALFAFAWFKSGEDHLTAPASNV